MQGTLWLHSQVAAALIYRTAAWWGQALRSRPLLPAVTPLRLSRPGVMPQMSLAMSGLCLRTLPMLCHLPQLHGPVDASIQG